MLLLRKKKHIFIDCGAHNGCSVRAYVKRFGPPAKIYSFEPNKKFHPSFKDVSYTWISKAVWIYDGKIEFYHGKNSSEESSSVIQSKINVSKKNHETVDCVDLSQWILRNFNHQHHLILKMDIEGAEYPIISKMLNEGSFSYIKRFFVEFHWDRIGMTKKSHDEFVAKIPLKWEYWDAL